MEAFKNNKWGDKMKRWLILIVVLMAAGCASWGNEQIRDQSVISQIQPGTTTKEEIRTLIGEPTEITFSDNGDETWKYVLSKTQMRASSFIPIVGLFTGGADMQSYTLTIRFKDNIVKFVGQGQMTGGGGNILDQ
jgi:outer membrane protein assembly factor BamE (lipoprotein component of BamABCDE complex)